VSEFDPTVDEPADADGGGGRNNVIPLLDGAENVTSEASSSGTPEASSTSPPAASVRPAVCRHRFGSVCPECADADARGLERPIGTKGWEWRT
jgi:hypothetical protein